jgi:hypothetical protein
VLGRILVVVYEDEGEAREHGVEGETFGRKYLWKREVAVAILNEGATEEERQLEAEDQFEIGDEDSDENEGEDEGDMGKQAFKSVKGKPPVKSEEPLLNGNGSNGHVSDPLSLPRAAKVEVPVEEDRTMPCLVDRLFSCTIDMLFCAGFTVPESVRGEDGLGEKINVSRHYCTRFVLMCVVCHLGEGYREYG